MKWIMGLVLVLSTQTVFANQFSVSVCKGTTLEGIDEKVTLYLNETEAARMEAYRNC